MFYSKLFVAGAVLISTLGFAGKDGGKGDGPGNTGDPFQYQVYDRAKFGLLKVKQKSMLTPELIAVLEKATATLTVDIDPKLATMAEVKPDEKRDGKRVVFLNPQLMTEAFDRRREPIDLTQWSLHEVFQTQIDPTTGRGYDVDEDITQNLRFSEKEFEKWLTDNKNKTASLASNEKPIVGVYFSLNNIFSKDIQIHHDTSWDDYQIGDVRNRKYVGFSKSVGSEFLNIEFKEMRNNRQLWTLKGDEPVQLQVPVGDASCSFSYRIDILFNLDSFSVEEKFPRMQYTKRDGCVAAGDLGKRHPHEYYLAAPYLHGAYARVAKMESEKAEKWKFFQAVALRDFATVEAMIQEGSPAALEDWRGRTPLMISAWLGDARLFELLAPLSNLAKKTDDGQDIFWFILNSGGKPEVLEPMLAAVAKYAPAELDVFPVVHYAFSQNRPDFFKGIFGDASNQRLNTAVVRYFDQRVSGHSGLDKEALSFYLSSLRGGILAFSGQDWNLVRTVSWMVETGKAQEFELLSRSATQEKDREFLLSQFLEKSKERCTDCDKFSSTLATLAGAGISPTLAYQLIARMVSRKDVAGYRALVVAGISIHGVDSDRKNVAMLLAESGLTADLEQALTVLDSKAVTLSKQTAISFAIGNDQLDATKVLYGKSDLDQLVGDTKAPLFIHASAAMLKIPVYWSSGCYNCVKKPQPLPKTLDILKLLMEDPNHPIDVKAADGNGKSALDYVTERIWSSTSSYRHFGRNPEQEAYNVQVYNYLLGKGVPHYKTKPPPPLALGIREEVQSQPVYSQPAPTYSEPVPVQGGRRFRFR